MRAIDADWLLDVVENIIDWDTERDKNRIIHQVRELTPTVDTEPRKGTWIDTGDAEETYGNVFKCSVCGAIDYEGNFCPNCGAKMEVTNGK